MENKSNYLLVGTMVLALLVAIAIFIEWMARVSGSDRKEYDIFFKQAVSGLARGSGVAFSGVPVGGVKTSALMPDTPECVRVRISVHEESGRATWRESVWQEGEISGGGGTLKNTR